MTEPTWQLLPTIVLRTTGFPWETVERLVYPRCRSMVSELLDLENRAHDLGEVRPPLGSLTRGQQARLRNLRPLPADFANSNGWVMRWNAVTGQLERLRAQYEAAVVEDATSCARASADLREDARFLEAVVCSSPMVYREFRRGGGGGRVRRQVAAYAQRLSTKCETMSFFGPINYARVEYDQPDNARLHTGDLNTCRGRQAFPASRVDKEIQRRIILTDDVVAHLAPRRKTFSRLPQRRLSHPLLEGLFAAADGRTTVADIAKRLGADVADVADALRAGLDSGFLTHDLCPPSTVPDTIAWVRQRISNDPAMAGSACATWLDELAGMLDQYPDGTAEDKLALQQRMALHTESAAASNPGIRSRFYNDRVIVHEAACGSVDLTLGGELAHDLAGAVGGALDLLAADAQGTRDATNLALAELLGVGTFSFHRAFRLAADLPIASSHWLNRRLADALDAEAEGITDLDITETITAPPTTLPILASVDVFVGVDTLHHHRSHITPLVLGDVHDVALLTPWALQFNAHAATALAERDDAIRRALGGRLTLTPIARRNSGLPPLEFPGLVLELGGITAAPPERRVTIDSLYVVSDGRSAALFSAAHDGPVLLHNGELESGFHTALALPRLRRPQLPDGVHVPRIRLGNVVLSRRRWTVPSAELAKPMNVTGDARRLLETARFFAQYDIPDQFFAKSPTQRKPLFVDSGSPLLLDGLARLARDADYITCSELLPSPERAWLRGSEGRYPAELRCVYLRAGADR